MEVVHDTTSLYGTIERGKQKSPKLKRLGELFNWIYYRKITKSWGLGNVLKNSL